MSVETIYTSSEPDTAAVGERLGASLEAGAVVLLTGQLGAGKTAFVRGLALGLGALPDDVTSPTFTLIQEYAGSGLTLHHVDLYRLEAVEIGDLGLDELIAGRDVVAIEWAERWPGRPDSAIEVAIHDEGEDRRCIEINRPT